MSVNEVNEIQYDQWQRILTMIGDARFVKKKRTDNKQNRRPRTSCIEKIISTECHRNELISVGNWRRVERV